MTGVEEKVEPWSAGAENCQAEARVAARGGVIDLSCFWFRLLRRSPLCVGHSPPLLGPAQPPFATAAVGTPKTPSTSADAIAAASAFAFLIFYLLRSGRTGVRTTRP